MSYDTWWEFPYDFIDWDYLGVLEYLYHLTDTQVQLIPNMKLNSFSDIFYSSICLTNNG